MSEGKTNWPILIATFTFPVAAIALVLAIRAGGVSSKTPPGKAAPAPPAPPHAPMPPGFGMGPHHGPPWGMGPPPWAGRGQGHGPGHFRPPLAQALKHLGKELGLTEQQRKKVSAVADEANKKLETLERSMREAQEKLHKMLEDVKTKKAAIVAQIKAVNDLHGQLLQLKVMTPWKLRAILEPEQIEKLKQLSRHRGLPWGMGPPPWAGRWKKRGFHHPPGRWGMGHGRMGMGPPPPPPNPPPHR